MKLKRMHFTYFILQDEGCIPTISTGFVWCMELALLYRLKVYLWVYLGLIRLLPTLNNASVEFHLAEFKNPKLEKFKHKM